MIRKAEFTSVWDDGKTKVTTSCEVDLKTREIVAIEKKEADVKNWITSILRLMEKLILPSI